MIKPKETFHLNPPVEVKEDWMIGLVDLEIYNSNFNLAEENKKLELYTDPIDSDFSFNELKDKVAEVLGLSAISTEDSEHELYGPIITKTKRKLITEKSQTEGYYILILKYMHSSFKDFESYLKILSSLDENDIHLIFKQYIPKFATYKIPPGVYTFKDLSEALSRGFKSEFKLRNLRPNHKHDKSDSIIIESDNVTLITKFFSRYDIKVSRFDEKSFFNTVLGFSPYWDYINYIPIGDNEYYSEKNRNLSIINKIHFKCIVIDGSVVNVSRQPILYSFVLNKPPGYKVFCDSETIHYKK